MVIRLIAAYFSVGYVFAFEHFDVIEPTYNLHPGFDVQKPYPFYFMLHQGLFSVMSSMNILTPRTQMLIIRIIHAIFSIITVLFGYSLAKASGNKRGAYLAFALLAFAWIIPFISVRNYAFNLAMPFIVMAVWLARVSLQKYYYLSFLGGLAGGLSIAIYPHAAVYWLTFILFTLFIKKPIRFLLLALGTWISLLLSLWYIHQVPISSPLTVWTYLWQNLYPEQIALNTSGWIGPLILALVLGPPLGFFVLFGFLRLRKETIRIAAPALVCFLIGTFLQNRYHQLFIAFPFIVLTGSHGWTDFIEKSKSWSSRYRSLYYAMLGYFWTANSILFIWISTVAPHQPLIDALEYIGKNPKVNVIVAVEPTSDFFEPVPVYYAAKSIQVKYISNAKDIDSLRNHIRMHSRDSLPGYVLFLGEKNLKQRIKTVSEIMPSLSVNAIFKAGFTERNIRRILHQPTSGSVIVYKNDYFY